MWSGTRKRGAEKMFAEGKFLVALFIIVATVYGILLELAVRSTKPGLSRSFIEANPKNIICIKVNRVPSTSVILGFQVHPSVGSG